MRTFLRRSWRDKALVLETSGWIAAARLLLLLSFRRTVALTAFLDARWPARDHHGRSQIVRLGRFVQRVSRVVPGATCLTQALALKWMLARRGIACRLRIGVRHDPGGAFAAHAWLETPSGEVVLGGTQSPEHYQPLPFETARFR